MAAAAEFGADRVVAVSAATIFETARAIRSLQRFRGSALFAVAEDDVGFEPSGRRMARRLPAERSRLVVAKGSGHGYEILDEKVQGRRLAAVLADFVVGEGG